MANWVKHGSRFYNLDRVVSVVVRSASSGGYMLRFYYNSSDYDLFPQSFPTVETAEQAVAEMLPPVWEA